MRNGILVGLLLALVAGVVASPVGPAGAASKFEASAGSELVRVGIRPDPSIVFDQPVDLGGAVAQARVNSLGASTAYASTPFPGDALVGLPGLTAGFTNGQVNLPEYPLYVNSDYPSAPERRAQAGALNLEAASRQSESRSTVTDGVNRSDVRVAATTGDVVTASADTVLGYVKLGALLSIDGLRSSATASLAPGGTLERTSSLSVGALVVAGQKIAVPPEQLATIGEAGSALSAALAPLTAQGVRLSYLAPTESEDGVTSAALQVSWTAPVPNYGQATITALLGRTFVHVSNQPLAGADCPLLGDVVAPPPASPAASFAESATQLSEPTAEPLAALPFPLDVPPAPFPSVTPSPVLLPGTAGRSLAAEPVPPPPTGRPASVPPPAPNLLAAPAVQADTTPASRLGFVLAVSALALLTTAAIFRRFGVSPR